MKKTLIASLLAVTATFTGCATIITGSTQTMSFKSVPEIATITITNKKGEKVHMGQTPATVTLKKSAGFFQPENYQVSFSKDGYQTQTMQVKSRLNGWYFGNIIFGGLVGILVVDPMTGAMFTLSPKDVNAVLASNGIDTAKNEKTLAVILKQNVPEQVMARSTKLN